MTPDRLTLADLRAADLDQLEQIYASDHPFALPDGRYRGTYLHTLDNPGSQALSNRIILLGFEYPPFGVDFDAGRWFFFHPTLLIGGFTPSIAPSRWRDTETVALDYQRSRLPRPIKRILYDEVKPLSDELALGIGGINAGPDRGDLFFFALQRF